MRLVVDAGPGTGKTAVACARVAHLINEGACRPSGVWLISFTRTAVKEIRDRIRFHLRNPDALYGVKIATVDAHAWSIHQGFSADAKLTGSFNENIATVIQLIEGNDEVSDYIVDETDHLIVDEAQDLVGIRADLIIRLVQKMRSDAGVTVFTDEAQAIYGFAGDAEEDGGRASTEGLTSRLMALGGFNRTFLHTVHRTQSPGLLKIFTGVRAMVLAPGADPAERLANVRAAITGSADHDTNSIFNPKQAAGDNVFVLFRRRSEVFQASSFLCEQKIPHRLRMSGLPPVIPPWLGAALAEFTERIVTRDQFVERCSTLPSAAQPSDPLSAWALIDGIARGPREGSVDLGRLRNVLGRAQPPVGITTPDYGAAGPVLGTIHAAKGRETDDVWMMLPPLLSGESRDQSADLNEEARIVFVGATRARKTLTLGRGYKRLIAKNLEGSGRVYALQYPAGKVRVELGRSGDIGASSVASRSVFSSPDDVRSLQRRLREFDGVALTVRADCDRSSGFIYRIRTEERDQPWGAFNLSLNADLFKIGNAVQARHAGGRRRPPDYFLHLYLTGIRTIVLRPDDPELEQLHEPWRTSGIVLAPMVHGLVTTFFPFRG